MLCAVLFFIFNSIISYKWIVISSNDPLVARTTQSVAKRGINQLLSFIRMSWKKCRSTENQMTAIFSTMCIISCADDE